jgi:hypothetical protein
MMLVHGLCDHCQVARGAVFRGFGRNHLDLCTECAKWYDYQAKADAECLDCLDAPPSKYGRLCDAHYDQRKSQLDDGGNT